MPSSLLVVSHRELHNKDLDVSAVVERLHDTFGDTIAGRTITTTLEGDYFASPWSDDVILAHKLLFAPSKEAFEDLRASGNAAYLAEVLERIATYQGEKPTLCLEAKLGTTPVATKKIAQALKEHGLDAYFDSFIGWKLDDVKTANEELGTGYKTSLHACAKAGSLHIGIPGRTTPDIITVPSALAYFTRGKPVIYGAVGSIERAQAIAEDPEALGFYWRGKEASSARMLVNSFRSKR